MELLSLKFKVCFPVKGLVLQEKTRTKKIKVVNTFLIKNAITLFKLITYFKLFSYDMYFCKLFGNYNTLAVV